MPDLRVSAAEIEGAPRSSELSASGNITSTYVGIFQEALAREVAARRVILVLLLKEVAYISSAGFAYLVELVDRLERYGGLLVLVDVDPKIRAIMETLGIDTMFHLAPTRDSAAAMARDRETLLSSSPRLVEVLGPNEGVIYPILKTVVTIGADPRCTILLKHPQIERRHAEIYMHGREVYVKDLGTRFGTFLGKNKITDEALKEGDIITVATYRYAFHAGVAAAPAGA
ncbi:MAG TPA: FHA domain-containing protein [Planctomycetota bacterium]|jgi:anti-anti-sigma factor|nr:FHA domain-containing protein [Planctomycetota bacterium]